MRKNLFNQSGILHLRAILAVFLCSAGMLLTVFSFAASPSKATNRAVMNKIAPWVVQQTPDGTPAEFLVVLDQADLKPAKTLKTKTEKGRYVRDVLWNKAQATQAPILKWLRANHVEHRSYYIVNLIWVRANLDVAAALAARSDVLRIDGNPQIRNLPEVLPVEETAARPASPDGTDETEAAEPGIIHTRALEVWNLGYRGQGVVVAGADTGYRWDHTALKSHYRGWDGTAASHDFNWHDSIHPNGAGTGGSCGADSLQPCDDNGHGTHTMGTVVGDDGGTNQTGMAPGARWIGCRNMDRGNGTPATYIECMEFFLAPYPVAGTPAQGDPNLAPDVTNNSWSCPPSEGCSVDSLQAAVEAQRAAGIMMVVSAGNEGSNCSTVGNPPGIYDAVYSIGALNTGTDIAASFSSRGPVTIDGSNRRKPDLCAPGTNTRSSTRTTTTSYGNLSGTSMASPHVAGAVALLWSAQPNLRNNVDDTEAILNETAFDILGSTCGGDQATTTPNHTYGYGRLDIKTAVDRALTSILSISRTDTGPITLQGRGAPTFTHTIEASPDLSPDSFAPIITITPNPVTGQWEYVDAAATGLDKRFYRLTLP